MCVCVFVYQLYLYLGNYGKHETSFEGGADPGSRNRDNELFCRPTFRQEARKLMYTLLRAHYNQAKGTEDTAAPKDPE